MDRWVGYSRRGAVGCRVLDRRLPAAVSSTVGVCDTPIQPLSRDHLTGVFYEAGGFVNKKSVLAI